MEENETKIKCKKLAKTVSVLAKINIGLGLLMLLASNVVAFGDVLGLFMFSTFYQGPRLCLPWRE